MVTHHRIEQLFGRGRHRSRRRSTERLVAAVVCVMLAGGVAVALTLREDASSQASACGASVQPLRVSAAPEIATTVRALVRSLSIPGCASQRVTVSADDPATVVAKIGQPAAKPDVWIPDSSLWLARLPKKSTRSAVSHGSLATSPIVLAVASTTARALGSTPSYRLVASAATTSRPIVLEARDPQRSAAALGALASMNQLLGGDAHEVGNWAALAQAMTPAPASTDPLPARPDVVNGSPTAVATSERAVWAVDHSAGKATYTAVYPPTSGPALDYPFVTLSSSASARVAADAVLAKLRGRVGRAAFGAIGFRAADGTAGRALVAAPGIDVASAKSAAGPNNAQVNAVLRALDELDKPSRLLTLIDVSGSMAAAVPGATGESRIDIVRMAAAEGLGLLPADSSVGLWRFSADLTPTTDYQQLVPLGPLNDGTRGQLADAVGQLAAVPNGGTGLYDSILAAVATVRQHFDPTRVNSVVVLTDGRDEADAKHAIRLQTLLTALQTQRASTRPVKVIAIAYGPSSDAGALRSITAASGGILYSSARPQDLPVIFRNAIGHRLCQSSC